ncbi:cobalamin biosynthesis protein CobQ [Psychromonas sp. psych-6C06]|uniref:ParA family protein n=1 Tax=Psychromonas sp. psych-6C06 TaxID=2058089 RepID=UPI000C345B26|nr:ParA family protein [Psychromonas sp. psych-6C06]PKF62923.1 cobalamin biosynthesis protein CobQ [Psychromonas sp. psych-6C06]
MLVWTVANQKGGVGKTTTVISLAGLLVERGFRVLLIDTDPHASLTSYLQYDSDQLPVSLYDLFQEPAQNKAQFEQVILPTEIDNLSLIPASMALATLDRVLGNKEGMGLFLKKQLLFVEDDYDVVLIDCPPVLGVMMVNALAACDKILVPVQTEFLASKGLERMVKTLQIMQKSRDTNFNYCIIPTMFDKRTRASLNTLEEVKATYSSNVWSGVIPIDTKFRDASLQHLPVSFYSHNCRGTFAYETLLNYLLQIEPY